MNQEEMGKWKENVLECQTAREGIDSVMEDRASWLIGEIRRIFANNGFSEVYVEVDEDNVCFTVQFDNDGNKIKFPKKMLEDLNMSMAVIRELTSHGNNRFYIELYPLEEA